MADTATVVTGGGAAAEAGAAEAGAAAASRDSRASARALVLARGAADVLAVWPAFLVAYAFGNADLATAAQGAALFSLLLVLTLRHLGLYRPVPSALGHREIAGVVRGVLAAGAAFGALLFLARPLGHGPAAVGGAVALAVLLVPIARRAVIAGARALTRRGWLVGRRMLICGAGRAGRLAFQQVVQGAADGRQVVGFVDDVLPVGSVVRCRVVQTGATCVEVPVLGRPEEWARVCAEHRVDELLVVSPWADPERTIRMLRRASELGIRAEFVPDLGNLRADLLEAEALGGLPVLRVSSLREARAPAGKRLFDVVGAVVLAVLTLPLWLVGAALVGATSPGPVLFVQERVGRDGRRFRMYKFRTMRRDADPYAPSPAEDVHPSITPVGQFLRVTGLDELPQLLNVLRGDMSLVGPRPEMPFIVAAYTPDERQRLHATPGVTGVWQLSPDRHAQIHENVEHDLYYVRNQGLLLDVVVLFETAVFTGALVARRLFARVRGAFVRGPAAAAPAAAPADAGPASADAPAAAAPSAGSPGYALVALDQRRDCSADRWQALLPVALASAERRPLRVLAARGNVGALDGALAAAVDAGGDRRGERAVEFVPYVSREQLREQCERAQLVITDLPHVAAWAREGGVTVVDLLHDPAPEPPIALPAGVAGYTPSAAVSPAFGSLTPAVGRPAGAARPQNAGAPAVPRLVS